MVGGREQRETQFTAPSSNNWVLRRSSEPMFPSMWKYQVVVGLTRKKHPTTTPPQNKLCCPVRLGRPRLWPRLCRKRELTTLAVGWSHKGTNYYDCRGMGFDSPTVLLSTSLFISLPLPPCLRYMERYRDILWDILKINQGTTIKDC